MLSRDMYISKICETCLKAVLLDLKNFGKNQDGRFHFSYFKIDIIKISNERKK